MFRYILGVGVLLDKGFGEQLLLGGVSVLNRTRGKEVSAYRIVSRIRNVSWSIAKPRAFEI